MNCKKIKKLIPVYLDGRLEHKQSQQVKDHVSLCPACRQEIEAYQRSWQIQETQKLLAGLDQEELEMVEDVELVENFDIIQEMDFLEDLEVIENLESLET